jgi:hypothetical protein
LPKTLIIILLIISGGCTAARLISESRDTSKGESLEKVISSIRKNNISEENFFIEKANLTVTINNETKKFVLNGKFIKPEKYLFSIRNNSGIEGARIYISKDTVLINERIGKRLLYGKPKDIEKISGLPYLVLSIIFGDMVPYEDRQKYETEQVVNQLIINQSYHGWEVKSVLDPKIKKVVSATFSSGMQKDDIIINYSKFGKTDKHIPGKIELKNLNRNITAKIEIKRIQIPWNGELEFIPGKGYIKEEIK